MRRIVKMLKVLLVVTMICIPALLIAQGFGDGEDVNDTDVPFDGGVSLLVAAGIGYGLKKVRDNKKMVKM